MIQDNHDLDLEANFVELRDVLDDVMKFIRRFVWATDDQLVAVALWLAHTYVADCFDVVAYLFITSPQKRSGKTLLLDLLEAMSHRGRSTANISPAALYRMVEESRPTLLFDEVDCIFTKGKATDPSRAELAGLINAGFRKGRKAYRMGGANMRQLESFDAFGPKALAGIGSCLPDATDDRCIRVQLERKARTVAKERYRIRLHEVAARDLGNLLGRVVALVDGLGTAWPKLPEELNDRQQDIWEPLLTIADAAGGHWPDRARAAAVALHAVSNPSESLSSKLLTDIRAVFTSDTMLTKHLTTALNDLEESPWGDWRSGNGISSSQVVNMLKPYGLTSKAMRVGADRGRGFERGPFLKVFDQYLDPIDDDGRPHDDDAVDTDDNGRESQVERVNDLTFPRVDASVDAADLHDRRHVNGVNTVDEQATERWFVGEKLTADSASANVSS